MAGTTPCKCRTDINAVLGALPCVLQAADWGRIQRAQLWRGVPEPSTAGGTDWTYYPPGALLESCSMLRWTGAPDPVSWRPDDGAEWRFRGQSGLRAPPMYGERRTPTYAQDKFLTLTTPQPTLSKAPPKSDDQRIAMEADGNRFTTAPYHRGNLLFTPGDTTGRPLTTEEREVLHGLPRGCTTPLYASNKRQTAIGNGWHIPSVCLLLTLLLGESQAHTFHSDGAWLPWWTPDGADHDHIWHAALDTLSPVLLPSRDRTRGQERFRHVDLSPLCAFPQWLRQHPQHTQGLGIDILALWM